jgi:hypothetical protein
MQREKVSEFSGAAGRVLWGTISGGSFASGIVIGLTMLVGCVMLFTVGAHGMVLPYTQAIAALALARFAANGLGGEWSGSLFSSAGGSWGDAMQVALRYLAMGSVWMLPVSAILLRMETGGPMMMMDPAMVSKLMLLGVISLLAMMLTPPLFLIIAVGADGFGDIFSPDHWKNMLSGRIGDLFSIYVIYSGALVVVMFLCMLPFQLASGANEKLGMLVAGICGVLILGISVNLLGRLCGFFARGELGLHARPEPAKRSSAPASAPEQPSGPIHARPASVPVSAPSEQVRARPASVPVSAPSEPTRPRPSSLRVSEPPTTPGAKAAVKQAPAPSLPKLEALPTGVKLPPLMDAQQRVERAMNRFDHDREGAISALVEMRKTFAPHPQVEHALTLCLFRCGDVEQALSLAKTALPLCLQRGHSQLAAAIYKEMGAKLVQQELNGEQTLAIAAALTRMEEWATAAKAYVKVIERDPGEKRAVEGMLQVAEGILNKRSNPPAAAKIYRYLLAHCCPSPLVNKMQQGLQETERRMAGAV